MIIGTDFLISVRFIMSNPVLFRKSIGIRLKIPIVVMSVYHIFPKFLFLVFFPFFIKTDQVFFRQLPRRVRTPVNILFHPVIFRHTGGHGKKDLFRRVDLIMFILKVQQFRRIRLLFHNYIFSVRKVLRNS